MSPSTARIPRACMDLYGTAAMSWQRHDEQRSDGPGPAGRIFAKGERNHVPPPCPTRAAARFQPGGPDPAGRPSPIGEPDCRQGPSARPSASAPAREPILPQPETAPAEPGPPRVNETW